MLKRTYKHTPHKGDQPLLESLLFACCWRTRTTTRPSWRIVKVQAAFFDWNEIRVSTVKELAEVMNKLPEPLDGRGARLKGILQSVFESDYSFDLEQLKKQNIGSRGQAAAKAARRHAVQRGLCHANLAGRPLDSGRQRHAGVLYVLGVISEAEAKEGTVPGMERAIPKSKGQEFGALLHELGADYFANPFSQTLRNSLLSIAPDAKDRFPKRAPKKPPAPPTPPPAPVKAAAAATTDKKKEKAGRQRPRRASKRPKSELLTTEKSRRPTPRKKPAARPKSPPSRRSAKRKPR